jgi:hypothetical protein
VDHWAPTPQPGATARSLTRLAPRQMRAEVCQQRPRMVQPDVRCVKRRSKPPGVVREEPHAVPRRAPTVTAGKTAGKTATETRRRVPPITPTTQRTAQPVMTPSETIVTTRATTRSAIRPTTRPGTGRPTSRRTRATTRATTRVTTSLCKPITREFARTAASHGGWSRASRGGARRPAHLGPQPTLIANSEGEAFVASVGGRREPCEGKAE